VSRYRNAALVVVAALLLNLAFPDIGWWPLAIVAMMLLWWALETTSAWGGFLLGWIFGITFLLPQCWWAHEAVGVVPWMALALAEGLAFALFGGAWASIRRSRMLMDHRALLQPISFAILWVGMEELRSIVPFGGFPWGRVAFSQVDSTLANLAYFGGAPLLSFVTVLLGAMLGLSFEAFRARRWIYGSALPVVAIGIVVGGLFIPVDAQAEDGRITVGVVQGNVPNEGLDSFNQARQVTRNHLAETKRLVATNPVELDVLIWPENSSDIDPREDAPTEAMIDDAVAAVQAPLLFGTIDYSPVPGRYNTSLLWGTNGQVLDEYRKQRPAPFAEYIPIRSFARHFSSAVDRVSRDVVAGEGPAVMDLPAAVLGRNIRMGTVICFEVAYDDIVRQSVRDGAEFVVVQTNNASFGLTSESTQQLAMTRLRAIRWSRRCPCARPSRPRCGWARSRAGPSCRSRSSSRSSGCARGSRTGTNGDHADAGDHPDVQRTRRAAATGRARARARAGRRHPRGGRRVPRRNRGVGR
jgi:apolipoprotein N-acyltransferase